MYGENAMKLKPPAGISILPSCVGLGGSSTSPATMSFDLSTYASRSAYVCRSSEPGALDGIVVLATSHKRSAVLPPYFWMNTGPLSGGPSAPSSRFGPWHVKQSWSYVVLPRSACASV